MPYDDIPEDTAEKIRNHRDDLEHVADSDLPVAWIADALLTIAGNDVGESAE